jgi:hypothetical protein
MGPDRDDHAPPAAASKGARRCLPVMGGALLLVAALAGGVAFAGWAKGRFLTGDTQQQSLGSPQSNAKTMLMGAKASTQGGQAGS